MNIKNLGTWLVTASLLAGLPACGGTAKNAATHGKYKNVSDEGRCVRDGGNIRCDTTDCAEGNTVMAVLRDGQNVPVGVVDGGDPTVEFVDGFLGDFTVICRGGDDSGMILLARMDDEGENSEATEPSGGTQITPSDSTTIAPENPASSGTPDAAKADKDGDGVPDVSDACPDLTGIGNGCPIAFTVTPQLPLFLGKIIFADLKATPRKDHFGMVDLTWSVSAAAENIEEMYVWSAGGFNRLPNEDSCAQADKRFLIVDPDTGLDYNEGSAKAEDVKDLLTGFSCTDGSDCNDFPGGAQPACRMNLKKQSSWRTDGHVATVAGPQDAGKYTLVLKLKSGETVIRTAEAGLPPAKVSADGNLNVSLDDSRPDGLYARVKFKFDSINPQEKIAVSTLEGLAAAACENGDVDVPESGHVQVDAYCRLKDKTSIRVTVPGYGSFLYVIELGEPVISTSENMTHIQLLAAKTTALSYHVSRSWTFTASETDAAGKTTQSPPVTGTFTDAQSAKSLKSVELLCYSYATDALETCGKAAATGTVFTDVPLDHDHATYKVKAVTFSDKTITSETFGFLIVTGFKNDKTGTPSYLTIEKASGVQCNSTPLTCYYSCGAQTCLTHDSRFDSLSQTFLIKMQHVRSVSWKCGAGTTLTVASGSNGEASGATFTPSNPYEASVLSVTVNSPNTTGLCALEIHPYYYVEKYSNGQYADLWADSCDSGAYTNTNPDYFSGLNLDHCE